MRKDPLILKLYLFQAYRTGSFLWNANLTKKQRIIEKSLEASKQLIWPKTDAVNMPMGPSSKAKLLKCDLIKESKQPTNNCGKATDKASNSNNTMNDTCPGKNSKDANQNEAKGHTLEVSQNQKKNGREESYNRNTPESGKNQSS